MQTLVLTVQCIIAGAIGGFVGGQIRPYDLPLALIVGAILGGFLGYVIHRSPRFLRVCCVELRYRPGVYFDRKRALYAFGIFVTTSIIVWTVLPLIVWGFLHVLEYHLYAWVLLGTLCITINGMLVSHAYIAAYPTYARGIPDFLTIRREYLQYQDVALKYVNPIAGLFWIVFAGILLVRWFLTKGIITLGIFVWEVITELVAYGCYVFELVCKRKRRIAAASATLGVLFGLLCGGDAYVLWSVVATAVLCVVMRFVSRGRTRSTRVYTQALGRV